MIIDQSYFEGQILLASKETSAVVDNINDYITQYEPEYLQKVLTYSLWKDFTTAIEGGSPAQRWLDLLNGAEFNDPVYQRLTKWQGFKKSIDGNTNISPIAYYTFCKIKRDTASKPTSSGETAATNDNSTIVSPSHKMVYAWNEMIKINTTLWQFLYVNKTAYGLSQFDVFYPQLFIPRGADKINMATTINDFDL